MSNAARGIEYRGEIPLESKPMRTQIAFASCVVRWCFLAICLIAGKTAIAAETANARVDRPNILWITSEDNGPQLGCYGDAFSTTPNIDGLAKKGMMYSRCWSNAPVCAPARTTIITGMYPMSFGGQNMRSRAQVDATVKLFPELLREQGYYCTNRDKEDYNIKNPGKPWNESSKKGHWRNRPKDAPFFSVFNFTVSHESQIRTRPHTFVHDPAKVAVPPYHPDTPEVRQDWAQYYDKIQEMDAQVGNVLQELKEDGLEDSTIVFFYGDHGSGMPRSKRWLYQSGLHVAMIVHVPEKWKSLVGSAYFQGTTSDRLISFVDLAPTVLNLAGVARPASMQGAPFLGPDLPPASQYSYGFRDRMDERVDMSRAIRDNRYLYIRNFMPFRPQGVYLDYMFQTPTTRVWKKRFDEGVLNVAQSQFWLPKPTEELYDLEKDPFQIHNLADLKKPSTEETTAVKQRLASALEAWMVKIQDLGLAPEGDVYETTRSNPERLKSMREQTSITAKTAMIASERSSDGFATLLSNSRHLHDPVRYWVAIGALNRAISDSAQRPACIELSETLSQDASPYVQAIAAETLLRYGSDAQKAKSKTQLKSLSDSKSTSLLVKLLALNSLVECEKQKGEFSDIVQGVQTKDDRFDAVYFAYIDRLVKNLTEN
jgi:arylsulfatase A-like enzyme